LLSFRIDVQDESAIPKLAPNPNTYNGPNNSRLNFYNPKTDPTNSYPNNPNKPRDPINPTSNGPKVSNGANIPHVQQLNIYAYLHTYAVHPLN